MKSRNKSMLLVLLFAAVVGVGCPLHRSQLDASATTAKEVAVTITGVMPGDQAQEEKSLGNAGLASLKWLLSSLSEAIEVSLNGGELGIFKGETVISKDRTFCVRFPKVRPGVYHLLVVAKGGGFGRILKFEQSFVVKGGDNKLLVDLQLEEKYSVHGRMINLPGNYSFTSKSSLELVTDKGVTYQREVAVKWDGGCNFVYFGCPLPPAEIITLVRITDDDGRVNEMPVELSCLDYFTAAAGSLVIDFLGTVSVVLDGINKPPMIELTRLDNGGCQIRFSPGDYKLMGDNDWQLRQDGDVLCESLNIGFDSGAISLDAGVDTLCPASPADQKFWINYAVLCSGDRVSVQNSDFLVKVDGKYVMPNEEGDWPF